MKTPVFRFTLYAIIIYLTGSTLNPTVAASQPSGGNGTHFCGVIDYPSDKRHLDQFPNRRYAQSFAANLNVGEPRTVRMIYFLSNDRPYRADVIQQMKDNIRTVQTFYAEQMGAHGYGKVTFRVETDPQGEPMVHRLVGQYPYSHYLDHEDEFSEITQAFDLNANIYLLVIDRRIAIGGRQGKNSGQAWVSSDTSWEVVAHELGHAFGLTHDFRNSAYIMSYGPGQNRLSACSAEFLFMHPYFNPNTPIEEGSPPTIKLISSRTYPAGSRSVPVRLQVNDSEGLHQVLLSAHGELKVCRGLRDEKDVLVEFDYDGVIPSQGSTSLSDLVAHPIHVEAVDMDGNVSETSFVLVEISPHHIVTLEGHMDSIHSVAFSPDRTLLASGSYDNMVKLWNVTTQQNIATLEGDAVVFSVSFSPDGTLLASGSNNNDVKLWDVATRQHIVTFEGHTARVHSVSFSPDKAILASASYDNTVKLWNVTTQQNIATLGHENKVYSVAFSPDGATLASGSEDGTVKLWNVTTQQNIATLGHENKVYSVAFSPDGATLASGGTWQVKLWDVATQQNIATLSGHTDRVNSVSFSRDGTTLASGAWDDTVILWDVATGENIAALPHTSWVNSVAFSPDGTILASGTGDGTVELWDTPEWTQPRSQRLVKIAGDNQQDTPGAVLANPLVVEVRDQYDNPLSGAQVTFTVTTGDGKLSGRFTVENVMTDVNGRAGLILTLGSYPGTNTVRVSIGGGEFVMFNAVSVGMPTTPSRDGNYRTWGLPAGAIVRLGKGRIGHADGSVAFSLDGQHLAVASYIGVWLYDAMTSRALTLLPTADPVLSVAFSPDGATLASGGVDSTVKLWNMVTQQNITTLWSRGSILSVSFSPDGVTLAAGSLSGVRLWDVATQQNIATLKHTGPVTSVSFSSDGATLASGAGREVKLWDIATEHTITTLKHANGVTALSFSPDGATLAAGSWIGVRLWEVATRRSITTLSTDEIVSLSFLPDGVTLAAGSLSGVRLWDVATGNIVTLEGHSWIRSASLSPDGATIASGSTDGTVSLWNIATEVNFVNLGHTSAVRSVSFSPNGTTLASGAGQEVKLWNVMTRQNIAILPHTDFVTSLSFSPDGTTIASGLGDDTVKLWNIVTQQNIATLYGHTDSVTSLSLSSDGATLASASDDSTVKLWDVTMQQNIATLEGHTDGVNSVSFSPDGTILASGSWDNTIKLWDVATRQNIATLEGHTDGVNSVSFSPDGTILASGSWDNTIKLWDVATRQNIATLEGHTDGVNSVSFSSNETTLVSGSDDGTILLWDMAPYITPITLPEFLAWDVNRDGVVNILDLVLVVQNFDQTDPQTDVNGDEAVNIFDLILVAQHFGESTSPAAPVIGVNLRVLSLPIQANTPVYPDLNSETVQEWIDLAHAADDGSLAFRQGIANLKRLLAALIPDKTVLLPNYPNPFNPETWIPYHLAYATDVTLTIYSTKGTMVRQLELGHQKAGYYTDRTKAAYWDGCNNLGEPVASGIYFYELRANDHSATRKMMVLK